MGTVRIDKSVIRSFIASRNRARQEKAAYLRKIRIPNIPHHLNSKRRRQWREFIRGMADKLYGDTPKPSLPNLRKEAISLWKQMVSAGEPHNPYSNEYYTACGYDDYLYEQRRELERMAAIVYAAYRVIGGKPLKKLEYLLSMLAGYIASVRA